MEGELHKILDGILALMDKELIPSLSTDESKVFYYKMKGDYYRYLAEFVTGEAKSEAGCLCRLCGNHQDRRERFGRDPSCPFGHGTDFLGLPI